MLGFAALSLMLSRSPKGWAGWAAWAAVLGSAALLYLHVAPGSPAWTVMGPVRIGEGTPYKKLLAFDKTGAGILLLALRFLAFLAVADGGRCSAAQPRSLG